MSKVFSYKNICYVLIMLLLILGIYHLYTIEKIDAKLNNNPPPPSTTSTTNVKHTYKIYTVDDMKKDLQLNALAASKKYLNKDVQIVGKLKVIDSDGKYICLLPLNDDTAITVVLCEIKNETQVNQIIKMTVDNIVVINGKITNVGEILGYCLEIDSIVARHSV